MVSQGRDKTLPLVFLGYALFEDHAALDETGDRR
jgi:hypothetical protein